MKSNKSTLVDSYIASFSDEIQTQLTAIRTIILETVPDAEEVISYQMPTYKFHGTLVHFAGYQKHIGFYPTPSGIKAFKEEISKYKNSKGAVQFLINQPLPKELIVKIIQFRMQENLRK